MWSLDNHKILTGLDVEVPIYRAKLTDDTRLVVRQTKDGKDFETFTYQYTVSNRLCSGI